MRSNEGFSTEGFSGGGFNTWPVARQIMNYYFGKRTFSSPIIPLPKGVK